MKFHYQEKTRACTVVVTWLATCAQNPKARVPSLVTNLWPGKSLSACVVGEIDKEGLVLVFPFPGCPVIREFQVKRDTCRKNEE